ncbi:hypothetical protein [Streptomyces sp. NPDC001020]
MALVVQLLALLGLGGTEGAPSAIRPWLYGAVAVAWASLTWRAVAKRIRVSSEGIHSYGLWRTRFVPWDDVVTVETEIASARSLLEYPTAILLNGSRVRLDGVYGLRG